MDIAAIKQRLRALREGDISFNEPHFTDRLLLRDGKREEVLRNLLQPEKLRYVEEQQNKKLLLVFSLDERMMLLPVVFRRKALYVITYIMRYRKWRN